MNSFQKLYGKLSYKSLFDFLCKIETEDHEYGL